jgi:hypothetical protein
VCDDRGVPVPAERWPAGLCHSVHRCIGGRSPAPGASGSTTPTPAIIRSGGMCTAAGFGCSRCRWNASPPTPTE